MSETIGVALITVGVLFDVFGCIGLVRLPDVYNRLQASTKCVTMGTCLILLGTVVSLGTLSAVVKGCVCIVVILITSPTGAHALARAAYRSGVDLWERSVVDRYREFTANATDKVDPS